MTYEELINNIAKSNSRSSNYLRLVGQKAYQDCIDFNDFIKILQEEKRKYKEQGIITEYKSYKGKMFTIYTKIPKFRTYKQQFAITVNTLEKELYNKLIREVIQKIIGEANAYAYEKAFQYYENLFGYQLCDPAEEEAEEDVYLNAYNNKLTELGNKYHIDVTPYLREV